MNDRELVDSIVAGEAESVDEFTSRFKKLIYHVINGFRFKPEDRADTFQDVFVKFIDHDYQALRAWDESGPLSAYVRTVTYHTCIDKCRKLGPPPVPLEPGVNEPLLSGPTPEEIAIIHQQREIVRTVAKEVLTERNRKILSAAMAGLTHGEIAAHHGMTVTNVGVVLSRSRKRVREAMRCKQGGARDVV